MTLDEDGVRIMDTIKNMDIIKNYPIISIVLCLAVVFITAINGNYFLVICGTMLTCVVAEAAESNVRRKREAFPKNPLTGEDMCEAAKIIYHYLYNNPTSCYPKTLRSLAKNFDMLAIHLKNYSGVLSFDVTQQSLITLSETVVNKVSAYSAIDCERKISMFGTTNPNLAEKYIELRQTVAADLLRIRDTLDSLIFKMDSISLKESSIGDTSVNDIENLNKEVLNIVDLIDETAKEYKKLSRDKADLLAKRYS